MKKYILTITLLGLFNHCFGQIIPKQTIKKEPKYILNLNQNGQDINWLETEEITSSKPNTKVLSDGVLINEKKHYIQIKQPDMSQLAVMPQVPIDTNTYYHIQIVGEIKEQRTKKR